MADFFSPEWAAEVGAAVEAGPSAQVRASKLQMYWDFNAAVRDAYTASWALGVRDLPGLGAAYLLVEWGGGHVTSCRVVDDPAAATYVLAGDYADWAALLGGYDAQRTVMYRKLLLEDGPLLEFFTGIYFFVESLSCLAAVPASLPAAA